MDSGFFTLEIQSLALTLDKKPEQDLSVRVDLELQNSHNVFKWVSSNTDTFSTTVSKPVLQHSESEDSFNYILGFDELTVKSVLLDLNDQVLTGLSNLNVKIKVVSINDSGAAPPAAKPAKGAPPPPATPAEEILLEVFIPLHSALTTKSGVISISQTLEELTSAPSQDVHVKVLYPNIVPATSSFGVSLSLDNGMTEYVLGCRILRWEWGSLRNADPSVWALKSPDVVDPKAKIQPTAAELRAKYIENLKRLVATQDKVAKFHMAVGAKDNEEGTEPLFPTLELGHGLIEYDFDLAATVPIEQDIRERADLWAVKWQSSPVIFLHRKSIRSFIRQLSEDSTMSMLTVLVKKTPAPEAAAVEGTAESSMIATVNVSEIIRPGYNRADITAENFNVSGQPLLQLSLSSNVPIVMPSLLQEIANMKPPKTEKPDLLQVSSNDSNKDVLKEVRDEIVSTIERISQEYLAIYPTAIAPPPTGGGDASAAPTQNRDEKKLEFITFLTSNGIFHELKENLKPRVQTLMKEKFGVRGRALGRSDTMKSVDLTYSESSIVSSNAVSEETIETALSELYVFLQKECAVILNSLFSDTLIDRDRTELTNSAFINDEEITEAQVFKRLQEQALDAAADLRYSVAENLHLERIHTTSHSIRLGSREDNIHEAYTDYAVFLLQQFAKMGSIAAPKKSVRPSAPLKTLLNRAREALSFAYHAKKEDWKVALLYACMLIECDQESEAEIAIHEMIAAQLTKGKYKLTSLQDFDEYDSDDLCPIDPKCYCVLATLFSLQKQPIRARKAILMAQRSFLEGGYQPPVSSHGSPRRTVVLCMTTTALYLLEHGFVKLGRTCLDLAMECEEAVTNKAQARGKAPVTVPHIRHLLKRAQTVALLYPVEPVSDAVLQSNQASNPLANAVDLAIESELAADNTEDKINAWLTIAQVQATLYDSTVVVNSYLNAMKLAADLPATELRDGDKELIPLDAFVSVGRLLLSTGRFSECIQAMLFAAAVYSSSTIFLLLGVSYLRLDKLEDAEEALIDANLLDSSNFDVWAYLTLLCLLSGPNRVEEAERSLFQALRLGLTNTALLRELATQFMAIDRMPTAEDLIRRALTQEAIDGNRQSLLSRKLLGNVLAAQNQAASAIEEYQKILSAPDGDSGASEEEVKQSKFEAAEKCYDLLSQLGREEEMKIVKNIMKSLSKDLHKQNLAAKGSKLNSNNKFSEQ